MINTQYGNNKENIKKRGVKNMSDHNKIMKKSEKMNLSELLKKTTRSETIYKILYKIEKMDIDKEVKKEIEEEIKKMLK